MGGYWSIGEYIVSGLDSCAGWYYNSAVFLIVSEQLRKGADVII